MGLVGGIVFAGVWGARVQRAAAWGSLGAATSRAPANESLWDRICKSFMAIAIKSGHLERYKQIVRLLYKYGRGDVLRSAGLDDPGAQVPNLLGTVSASTPRVHSVSGEIL